MVGPDGVGNFGAYLRQGATSPGQQVLFGPGLVSTRQADVHLVIHNHGAPIPGLIYEQLHTFGGGCSTNSCRDLQAAAHEAA